MKKKVLPRQIDILYSRVVEVFSKQPEVHEVYTFGSIINGKFDKFSDIDIDVVSSNYNETINKLDELLKQINDPISKLCLYYEKDKSAFSILWKDYSLYQKLDLGITNSNKKILFSPKKLVYKNKNSFIAKQKKIDHLNIYDTSDREIVDFLHGIIRFLKYNHRKMYFASFKFYRSALDELIRSTYLSKYNKKIEILTLEHYMHYDEITSSKNISPTINSMKRSIQLITTLYVELFSQTKLTEETLILIKRVQELLESEIHFKSHSKLNK